MFGISFGTKKNSGSETQNLTSNTTGTQTNTGTQNQSTTGTQNTTQNTQNNSTGSSATTGSTKTNESQVGSQIQTGTTTNFSDATLSGLESAVGALLGGVGKGAGATAANNALTQMGGFDSGKYVSGVMDAARSDTLMQLEESVNGAASTIGGTAGTNSAQALLADRLGRNRAATLAGVESQATSTAQQILASQAQAGTAASSANDSLLASLSQILKGGTTSTTGAATTTQASTGGSSTSSNTNTSEQQNQTQNTNTSTVQDVLTQIQSLLSSNEVKTGTNTTNSKGTTSGGGLSLGF